MSRGDIPPTYIENKEPKVVCDRPMDSRFLADEFEKEADWMVDAFEGGVTRCIGMSDGRIAVVGKVYMIVKERCVW